MKETTIIPSNTSLLQSTKYSFILPTLPFLKYFSQTANIPGVSTSSVAVANPFSDTHRHGNNLRYDSLSVNAIIDEDIKVWEETYNWLKSLTRPTDYAEYVKYYNNNKTPYHDGVLTINSNSNNPKIRIKYKNCHPVSLGGISFNTADSADTTLTAEIQFRYDTFYIERM